MIDLTDVFEEELLNNDIHFWQAILLPIAKGLEMRQGALSCS